MSEERMTSGEEFRTYMKATSSGLGNDDRHLNETEMIAFCRGEMAEVERDAAREHLAVCDYCVGLFRSARDFLEPAGTNDEEVASNQTSDAWQSLWQRVQTTSPKTVPGAGTIERETEFQRKRDKKFFSDWRVTYAMAASLLISFGMLGFLGWRLWQERQSRQQAEQTALQLENKQRELEQRLSQLEQTSKALDQEREQRRAAEAERDQLQSLLASVQPERVVVPVYPFTLSSERGSGEDLNLSFKKDVQAVRLKLFQSKPYAFAQYAVELVDGNGRVVQRASRLRPAAADGALFVLLKRTSFGPGNYKLRLFGLQGKTRQQLGEYGVNVTVQ
jgi:hypothetical protein